jgi:thioredoxin 1
MLRFTLLFLAAISSYTSAQAQVPELTDDKLYQLVDTETKPMLLLYRYTDSKRFQWLDQRLIQLKDQFKTETGSEMLPFSMSIQNSRKSVEQIGVKMSPTLVALKNGQVLATLELVVDEDADQIPGWFFCALKINPEKNCKAESIIPRVSFLKLPEIIASKAGVVLVELNATYCMPCRWLAPVVEEIAHDRKDITFLTAAGHVSYTNKADEERHNQIMASYGLNGAVPALLLFKDGKLIRSRTGYDKSEGRAGIEAWIN